MAKVGIKSERDTVTTTAQVDTFTLNNDFNNSETDITITLVNEGGGTQTESIDPSGTDESAIATALQAKLNSSTQSLFAAIAWTVATTVVTATAKTAGVPFYASSAVTGGAGTITDATSTPNSGPNDWGTAAIFSAGSIPVNGDQLILGGSNRDIRYGLVNAQRATSVALNQFKVMPSYNGILGDPEAGFFLELDVNNASSPVCIINAQLSRSIWLSGTRTSLIISGTSSDENALRLKGTDTTVRITGLNVRGKITWEDSSAITNFSIFNAPNCRVLIGDSVTALAKVEINSGADIEIRSEIDAGSKLLRVLGGLVRHIASGNVDNVDCYGGELRFMGGAAIGTQLFIKGGIFTMKDTEATSTTIEATTIEAGLLQDAEPGVTTWTNSILKYGGIVNGAEGSVITIA